MRVFLCYVLGVGALLVVGYKLLGIFRNLFALFKLKSRQIQDAEQITTKKLGDAVDLNAIPVDLQMISPVSRKPCLWWSFDVLQLNTGSRSDMTVPLIQHRSRNPWLIFEGKTHFLGIKIHESNQLKQKSFEWNTLTDLNMPQMLMRYIESLDFRENQNLIDTVDGTSPPKL